MGTDGIREVKRVADFSRAYREHVHDELSAAHVWCGSTEAIIGGERVPVAGECLVLIAPGVPHACNPRPGAPWSYTLALLAPDADLLARMAGLPCRILPTSPGLQAGFRSVEAGAPASGLLEALRAGLAVGSKAPAPPRPAGLRRAEAGLRGRLDAPLDLDELSVLAGLSKYHLVRAFRRAYGLSPHAYHLNLRVNEAKRRLRLGCDPASVAQELGFCDQSHLNRVFVKFVGMAPAEYRKATAIPSKTKGSGCS